ncbi:hypothetical protein [Stenotrophomonas sp. MYb57]|uniref:hypothetical protein n=1 Tax=Stenotrophomonas sp. MYb57 TaxID=1827305 RepID=UPI00131A0705|nr:hypothetical protein [Stenotrophomonas sp. MYb57]
MLIYREQPVNSKGLSAPDIEDNFDSGMFIAEHFDAPKIIVEIIDAPTIIAEESDLRLTIAEHFGAPVRL